MLDALVAIANRFERDGKLPPVATREIEYTWSVTIAEDGQATLSLPYKREDFRMGAVKSVRSPDKVRSGSAPPPLLLTDKARYALDVPRKGNEKTDHEGHRKFVELVRLAHEECSDAGLAPILAFLAEPHLDGIGKVQPDDYVAFADATGNFPCERKAVHRFWAGYRERELMAGNGVCLVCGQEKPLLRLLPNTVAVFGQSCQITSFEKSAFRSFGKGQTENAPICFACASRATTALTYLLRTREHHATLVRVERNGVPDPFASQMAVFWTKEEVRIPNNEGEEVDLNIAVAEMFAGDANFGAPVPELAQLEKLLKVPWTASDTASNLNTSGFCLAVLSASKARLVVREWLDVPLDDLQASLKKYIEATRIIGPQGEEPRSFPIPALLAAVGRREGRGAGVSKGDPNWTRAMLRTAYTGTTPPSALLNATLTQFGKPKHLTATTDEDRRVVHCLASLLQLLLTHREGETEPMTKPDEQAHLCGRVLAIVEEMQRRSADAPLNTTLVERFYNLGSISPQIALANLTALAEMAYMPKIRKQKRGFQGLQNTMTETMAKLDACGPVPQTFNSGQRAAFALGLYKQRAEFAQQREERKKEEAA